LFELYEPGTVLKTLLTVNDIRIFERLSFSWPACGRQGCLLTVSYTKAVAERLSRNERIGKENKLFGVSVLTAAGPQSRTLCGRPRKVGENQRGRMSQEKRRKRGKAESAEKGRECWKIFSATQGGKGAN